MPRSFWTRSWLAALVGLVIAGTAVAALRAPPMEMKLDDYSLTSRSYCFPSGIRIIFQEDRTEPIVSLTMVIDKGSADDLVGEEGLAHLVEHLWFRSKHGEAPKVWDMLKEMGASLNATTGSDATTYLTVAPREMLPALLRLEALRLSDPLSKVTELEVTLEKEIVRNELRMRYENGQLAALEHIRHKLFPEGHPYSRLGIGSHDTITGLNLEMAQTFVKTHYIPKNATLVVVGDFDLDQSGDFIAQAFPPSLIADPNDPEAELKLVECPVRVDGPSDEPPPPVDTELSTFKAGVDRKTLALAWSMPGAFRENEMLLKLAANSLNEPVGEALSWHMSRRVGGEDVGYGGCSLIPEEHASTALCLITLGNRRDPDDIAHRVANYLNQLWQLSGSLSGTSTGGETKIFQDHAERQKYYFSKARWWSMLQLFQSTETVSSLFGRGAATAKFAHFTGDANYFSTNFMRLNQVDPADARYVIEKYLNRDRMVGVVLEPYEKGEQDTSASEGSYVGRPREPVVDTAVPVEKIGPEYIRALVKPPALEKLSIIELDNGLEVVMLPHGDAPLVRSTLMFGGAEMSEPSLGFYTVARRFTEIQPYLYNRAFSIAGNWSMSASSDHQYKGMRASSANLDAQLYLLRETVENLEITGNQFREFYFESMARGQIRARNQPQYWAARVTDEKLTPNHPLSRYLEPEHIKQMQKIRPPAIQKYNKEIFQPANATLFIVGRFDASQAEKWVAEYFGSWNPRGASGKAVPPPPGPTEPVPGRKVMVFHDENVTQTAVRMTCPLPKLELSDYETKQVLRATLDEMAWVALREESAVTYGAGAFVRNYPGGTSQLGMASSVQNSAADMAVKVFLDLSDRAAKGELDPDLVTLMKAQIARQFALGQQTTAQVTSRLVQPWSLGWGLEFLMGYGPRLSTVSPEKLTAQMKTCNGNEIITLVGPEEEIVPRLTEAGIEHEVYDWRAEADKRWEQQNPREFKRELERREEAKKKEAEEAAKKGAEEAAPSEETKGE